MSGSSVLLMERLFGKFAAVEAVMRHPPRCVAIARDVQLNARIAGTGFGVVRPQVVDRDEVNLCRPNPSRPPPVARASTSQLGAMDGVDDHGRTGLGSWSMSRSRRFCAAMICAYSPPSRACLSAAKASLACAVTGFVSRTSTTTTPRPGTRKADHCLLWRRSARPKVFQKVTPFVIHRAWRVGWDEHFPAAHRPPQLLQSKDVRTDTVGVPM
jgi:hypothetical protein